MKPANVVTLLVAASLAVAVPLPGGAQPADPPATQPTTQPATQPAQPPARARELLTQLDHAEYAQRESAETALLDLAIETPGMSEWLEQLSRAHPSPEVRTRVTSVLVKLEEHRLLGATKVTIQANDVHPRQIVAELARQAGVKIEYWPEDPWEHGGAPAGDVSIDIDGVPFWEAIQQVADLTGLYPTEHQGAAAGSLLLSPSGQAMSVSPTLHHGAFAVQLRRVYRNQNAHMELGVEPGGAIGGNATTNRSLSLEMRMLVEPKIRLAGPVTQPILEEAIDENGRSLLLKSDPRGGGRAWSHATAPWSVQSTFELDADAGAKSRKIARLRGRVDAEIATSVEVLDLKVDDLLDMKKLRVDEPLTIARTFTVGTYRIEVATARRPSEQNLQFDLALAGPELSDQNQETWMRAQALFNSLRLEDAAGRAWQSGGGGFSGFEEGAVKGTRSFYRTDESVGQPARLVWELPLKTMRVSIPFEFTEIPLPTWE